jgi:sugar phosphate isomerase/epimerase
VIPQLERIARQAEGAASVARNAGVRICLENHTEAFSDEVLWIINRVNHPYVGACVDTNNSLMVGEDPPPGVPGRHGKYPFCPRGTGRRFRILMLR